MASGAPPCPSSLGDDTAPCLVPPHYRESYRLAIYALLCGGRDAYLDYLSAERIGHFLSEEEILFILESAELPPREDEAEVEAEAKRVPEGGRASTYFPTESDEEVPDLDLGWPEVKLGDSETSISLLFHPPRHNTPTVKEVVRRQMQDAKQVIAIAVDVFTDVDLFMEVVGAALRGVAVYILLDDRQFGSFLTMSEKVGVRTQDLKNMRVRTVRGQQYRCRSGAKFYGALQQKFILVDCRTVLHGTYSYTWSFEKVHLSMVQVITGQLVGSYDEEFRRLFARSAIPVLLSRPLGGIAGPLYSPNSSQLSLQQINVRPRMTQGLRSRKGDAYPNSGVLTKGLSMQDWLHQSHTPNPGNLVRGHSYAGELQWLNSGPRIRAGARDHRDALGPSAPDRSGAVQRGGEDRPLPSRVSHPLHRHRSRYGADQNLIPFNSETSLHKWKMDSYFSNTDPPTDPAYDVASPQGSQQGLNDPQPQVPSNWVRDIKSRLDEIRLKRLSLQEYTNPRQSQESLRPMFSTLEMSRMRSSIRALDKSQSMAELEENVQPEHVDTVPGQGEDRGPRPRPPEEASQSGVKAEEPQRSVSHFDIQTASGRRTSQTFDWHEPLSRTTSAVENLDTKGKEASLKPPIGRVMDSLLEIPEEKDFQMKTNPDSTEKMINHSGPTVFKRSKETVSKEEKAVTNVDSVMSDRAGRSHSSTAQAAHSPGQTNPEARGGKKTPLGREATRLKVNPAASNTSAGSQQAVNARSSLEKLQDPALQRKNSVRSKVGSMPTSGDHKRMEEKSLHRKNSVRSQTPTATNLQVPGERTKPGASPVGNGSALQQKPLKGQSPSVSSSHNAIDSLAEAERERFPLFERFSLQRSSKRRAGAAAGQDRGSGVTLESEGSTACQTRKDKDYGRFEHFLNSEKSPPDKPARSASMRYSDKERNSLVNSLRRTPNHPACQTPSADNRLGRFMQRVGNLISKNK